MIKKGGKTMDIKIKNVKHETPKAWLAIMEDDKEVWLPKSQCQLKENVMSIPDWLVEEKELNEYDQ